MADKRVFNVPGYGPVEFPVTYKETENGLIEISESDYIQRHLDAHTPRPVDPSERINRITEVFAKAITETASGKNTKLQKELLKLGDSVERAIKLGLYEAAREIIKEPTLPADLEPYRTQMLNALP